MKLKTKKKERKNFKGSSFVVRFTSKLKKKRIFFPRKKLNDS